MRTTLLAGVLLLSFAAPGFAQMQNGNQGEPGHYWNHHDDDRDGGGGWMQGRWMHGDHMRGMMQIAHELAAGAFFRFKRGDDEVDVHCPPNQSLQDCVGAASQLMRNLPQTGTTAATGQTQH